MTSYLNFGSEEDYVLSISTSLGVDGVEDLSAHFLLIPDEDSLNRILHALNVA
jgi:hypothetical protein